MLINAVTFNNATSAVDRTAGFSDGWYQDGSDAYDYNEVDAGRVTKRAALLPTRSTVVGVRISDVDAYGVTTGKSRTYKLSNKGGQTAQCDDPRMSLLYDVRAQDKSNELNLYIQNVPDIRVAKGSYNPDPAWQTAVQQYLLYAFTNNYGFMGLEQQWPKIPVQTISALGVVVTKKPHGMVDNQYVRFLRTSENGYTKRNPSGYQVKDVVDAYTFSVWNWDGRPGIVSTGGSVTTWGKTFCKPTLNNYSIINPMAATRKVGRPFFQYRGRASKKPA